MVSEYELKKMGELADEVIANWSLGALVGNLLPPPFDYIAVGTSIAKMGLKIAEIYNADITWDEIKRVGMLLAKGLGAVAAASYAGSSLLKYIPGVNIWVGLLMQPPIVGAMTYAAGYSYKSYFEVVLTKGRMLSDEEIKRLAERAFMTRKKLFK